jgi:hypothetical protein
MNGKRLFVAIPVYRDVPGEFVLSLLEFTRYFPGERKIHLMLGDSLIPQARNRLTADFLASDCTHCLFVDCDVIFTSRDVERLLSHNESFVGGLYAAKRPGGPIFEFDMLPHKPSVNERGLLPVGHIGAGFLLIARTVFEVVRLLEGWNFSASARPRVLLWRGLAPMPASNRPWFYGVLRHGSRPATHRCYWLPRYMPGQFGWRVLLRL